MKDIPLREGGNMIRNLLRVCLNRLLLVDGRVRVTDERGKLTMRKTGFSEKVELAVPVCPCPVVSEQTLVPHHKSHGRSESTPGREQLPTTHAADAERGEIRGLEYPVCLSDKSPTCSFLTNSYWIDFESFSHAALSTQRKSTRYLRPLKVSQE